MPLHRLLPLVGAPTVGWAMIPRERVTIEGDPGSYESSPGTVRRFCGTCSTELFYLNEGVFPVQIDVQPATLYDLDALAPQARIQTADALAWFGHFDALPNVERFPG